MRTDVQLHSPTLDAAKALMAQGWKFGHDGAGVTLQVWLQNPNDSKNYVDVDPAHFRELAAFGRELKELAQSQEPRTVSPTHHILTPSSSAIYSYGYDPDAKCFEIRYKSAPATCYIRSQVPPEVFEAARKSESIGSFIGKTFNKSTLDTYPETKRVDSVPIPASAHPGEAPASTTEVLPNA